MSKSIAVFGGSGFVGRKICEVGIRRGWDVTALSRSGRAPSAQTHADHSWIQKVKWSLADLFDPESYKQHLAGKNAVVHSVGILFENSDYKDAINSNFNFLNDMLRLGKFLKGPNPMEKNYKSTYEAIQRDTAVLLADKFVKETDVADPAFVYISAEMKPPFVPEGYLTSKREAEFELACKEGLRSIFMRPGMLYDDSALLTDKRKLLGRFLSLGYNVKEGVLGDSIQLLNDTVRPPLATEQLAQKIYEKLEDPDARGVVPLEEIMQ